MSEVDYLCVLLVEDNEGDAERIRTILAKCRDIEFVVEQVRTVDEAQDKLNEDTYDIVLLDFDLGNETGFDLMNRLDSGDLFAPPIIMVTNCESRKVDLRAQEAGLDDFLIKDDLNPALLERSIRFSLERKDNQQRLQWMAYYDQLTELPNRAMFNKVLIERIEEAAASGASFPLMLLDLDHFKDVNDTLGHPVGDELLQMVAQRIQTCTEPGAFAARLGGDEFVVIGRANSEWTEIQTKVEEIITVLSETYRLSEHNITTSTSIGIALYPDNGTDYSELLKNADRALYEAKDAGRNTWRRRQNQPQFA